MKHYRERSLKDVITQLEPGLFKKVTGLDVKDFELLCSIGVFNATLMNDAIFKFKRYEDASLSYTGIDMHEGDDIGGWDTVIKREEYERLFYNQQATMEADQEPQKPILIETEQPRKTVPVAVKKDETTNKPKLVVNPIAKPEPKQPRVDMVVTPKKVESVLDMDLSGAVAGAKVKHKKFGEGTIEKIDKGQKHINVSFSIGQKTFIFPDAFMNGFLELI